MSYSDKKEFQHETILVSAVAGDIGAAAVRSLQETGVRIIGCDVKPYSPVSSLLEKIYQVPPADQVDAYFNGLEKCIRQEKVSCFLPISEPEIAVLHANRSRLQGLGVKMMLNNAVILDNFLDKLQTSLFLARHGIDAPGSMLLADYDGSFGFPVIVKARRGWGSRKLWIAEDNYDLDYLRRKDDGGLLAQQYIGTEEEEFTTGVFSDGTKISVISFRRQLGFGGLSAEAVLVAEPELDELANRIAQVTGLNGAINIQTRRPGGKFLPFEINPRLSSTLLFRKKFGFDDAVWWLSAALGRQYDYQKKYLSGRALRYTAESYFDLVSADNE